MLLHTFANIGVSLCSETIRLQMEVFASQERAGLKIRKMSFIRLSDLREGISVLLLIFFYFLAISGRYNQRA